MMMVVMMMGMMTTQCITSRKEENFKIDECYVTSNVEHKSVDHRKPDPTIQKENSRGKIRKIFYNEPVEHNIHDRKKNTWNQ